jgi:hypothetical protein
MRRSSKHCPISLTSAAGCPPLLVLCCQQLSSYSSSTCYKTCYVTITTINSTPPQYSQPAGCPPFLFTLCRKQLLTKHTLHDMLCDMLQSAQGLHTAPHLTYLSSRLPSTSRPLLSAAQQLLIQHML